MPLIALRCKAEVVVKGRKLTPTKRALGRSEDGIAKQYFNLQKLREEVRQAEISLGIRMHNLKGRHTALMGVRLFQSLYLSRSTWRKRKLARDR